MCSDSSRRHSIRSPVLGPVQAAMPSVITVQASAPGKVILFGEHSVVHGHLCIAGSISLRAFVELELFQAPSPAGAEADVADLNDTGYLTFSSADSGTHIRWPISQLSSLRSSVPNATSSPAVPADSISDDDRFSQSAAQSSLTDATRAAVKAMAAAAERLPHRSDASDEAKGSAGQEDLEETRRAPMSDGEASGVEAFLFLYLSLVGAVPGRVSLRSTIPLGAGLGSSAAFCTAIAAACLAAAQRLTPGHHQAPLPPRLPQPSGSPPAEPAVAAEGGPAPQGASSAGARPPWQAVSPALAAAVCEWAFLGECLIHGRPSGVDNMVSARGGLISFQQGSARPLPPVPALRLLLCHTRVPRRTSTLVASVAAKAKALPAVMASLMAAMHAVAGAGRDALLGLAGESAVQAEEQGEGQGARSKEESGGGEGNGEGLGDSVKKSQVGHSGEEGVPSEGNGQREQRDSKAEPEGGAFESLAELMRVNQHLLQALGVSHKALDSIFEAATKHGLSTKLTGAGGGGCSITLLPPGTLASVVRELEQELEGLGFECFVVQLGGSGVLIQ